jgi:hypothetical protein
MILKALGKILGYTFGYSLLYIVIFHVLGGSSLWESNNDLYTFIAFVIVVLCFGYSLYQVEEESSTYVEIKISESKTKYENDIAEIKKFYGDKISELKADYENTLNKNNNLVSEILHEKNQIYSNNDYLNNKLKKTEKEKEDIYKERIEKINNLNTKIKQFEEDETFTRNKLGSIVSESNKIKEERDLFKNSLLEKNKFFPSLLSVIEKYEELRDGEIEDYLLCKKNPSRKGSEIVREQTRLRRIAETELKKSKFLIESYENIAPFLLEFKEDLEIPDEDILEEYSEDEQQDFVTKYLSKEEYRKLPSIERNQMALDRFWKRPNKSKWLLGLLYERYIGYLYEEKGYNVNYHGASEGRKDLGRDLICEKKGEILIVQCKYWSQFKTIHEKHIFQLFGTTFQYKYNLEKENKGKKVKAIFCTSTTLSDVAREFAKELEIEVRENVKLERSYPCIKCNIGRTSDEKIYHLPFDQQYNKIVIEPKRKEFYCATVKEAEDAGFRRAYRYKGIEKK